jgi:transcription antitermination factor NusG
MHLTWQLAVYAPGVEHLVAARLARQQLPFHIFRHLEIRVARGRKQERLVPTFPRYVFAWCPIGSARREVSETYGIVAMVQGHLPQIEMDRLLAVADGDSVITFPKIETQHEERFLPGERVRVAGGPYQGFDAIWSCRSGAARCRVLLGMMGRQVPIDMDDEWLEAAQPRPAKAKHPRMRHRH